LQGAVIVIGDRDAPNGPALIADLAQAQFALSAGESAMTAVTASRDDSHRLILPMQERDDLEKRICR
jgi:hypothetical protein